MYKVDFKHVVFYKIHLTTVEFRQKNIPSAKMWCDYDQRDYITHKKRPYSFNLLKIGFFAHCLLVIERFGFSDVSHNKNDALSLGKIL